MRIVAIETSGRLGSLATLLGDNDKAELLRQISLTEDQRTAQALAPALRELMTESGWPVPSIELICVATGPGSFTGLRIGVTTAKTLAYAVGAKVVAVNTLAALAAQAAPANSRLWTVVDAQRQELFVAKFDALGENEIPTDCDIQIVSRDAWLAGLQSGDRVTGPALRRLAPQLPKDVTAVPEDQWQLSAAAVGRVGWRAFQAGRSDDIWKLAPNYIRPSYAEEKRK